MKVRSLAAPLGVLVFLTVACANSSTTSGGGGGDAITYPTGAGDLVLRIDDEGGFVSTDYVLTALPERSRSSATARPSPPARRR